MCSTAVLQLLPRTFRTKAENQESFENIIRGNVVSVDPTYFILVETNSFYMLGNVFLLKYIFKYKIFRIQVVTVATRNH